MFHTDLESAEAALCKAGFYGNEAPERSFCQCVNVVDHSWEKEKKNHGQVMLCLVVVVFSQRAAQVLDEFDDEDIGVGLIDAKLDKVVAKKLGK